MFTKPVTIMALCLLIILASQAATILTNIAGTTVPDVIPFNLFDQRG
jgi:hypothetical protein